MDVWGREGGIVTAGFLVVCIVNDEHTFFFSDICNLFCLSSLIMLALWTMLQLHPHLENDSHGVEGFLTIKRYRIRIHVLRHLLSKRTREIHFKDISYFLIYQLDQLAGLQNTRTTSLQRGETLQTSVLDMTLKKSDGEVPVTLEIWWMLSTPSFPLLPGPDRVQSMGQIKLNYELMISWIAWNRTVLTFKLRIYAKVNCLKLNSALNDPQWVNTP